MDRQTVIELLRAAETDAQVRHHAEAALATYMLHVARKEVQTLLSPHRDTQEKIERQAFLEEGVNRAFERLKTWIMAQGSGMTPRHVVRLAAFIIQGGYPPGRKSRIPGVFAMMLREQRQYTSRHASLFEPVFHEQDMEEALGTLADLTPNPTVIPLSAEVDGHRTIRRWVEELAYRAEAHDDRVKRLTLNALILHLKHRVVQCNNQRAVSPLVLQATAVEVFLAQVNLNAFDAGLFDKTRSQWTMRKDVSAFLIHVMGPYQEDPHAPYSQFQNTVRRQVDRVLPILSAISLSCQSDICAVTEMCREKHILPDTMTLKEGDAQ